MSLNFPTRGWLVCLLAFASIAAADRDHRLADAAEKQDRRQIASLLRARVDVNAPQPDGATALHWAVYQDDEALVEELLRAGASPRTSNDNGVTPLALACENRNEAIVNRLLKSGADPNVRAATGESPLMIAARAGHVPIVGSLIARGADVNAAELTHGQTALMWAVSERHPDVVRLLIDRGASVQARSRVRHRTVQVASRYGDQNSVRGVTQIDLGGFTPVLFAARVGDVDSARHLLAAGANVNDTAPNGASVLVVAAHSGQGEVARLLLDRGADPNANGAGYTALHAAVLRGDLELVRALIAKRAAVDTTLGKGTPSRYYSKDFAFNENLVGATPLWLAARYGEVEIMRALAQAGANPRASLASDGTTALMAAIIPTRGLGAFRIGDRRERYQGPADIAAKADGEDDALALETTRCVIDLGADVNAVNQDGDTALHLATALGLGGVVQLLADRGAALNVKNKREQTPLALTAAPTGRAPFIGYATTPAERSATADLLRRLGATE